MKTINALISAQNISVVKNEKVILKKVKSKLETHFQ